MDARPALGRNGEDIATELYENLDFTILDRNFRCSSGELDIVAAKDRLVVFCEVKTRRTNHWGEPSEAVNHVKRARLRRLAAIWLSEKRPGRVDVRFDVVSVIVAGGRAEVTHLEDAF
ncbi:MAG: putative endonuclease [Actinomycetota bacterium]|jgi:putative endonuclease|nr:putative endonuclease [Actinomycetota bacterium]